MNTNSQQVKKNQSLQNLKDIAGMISGGGKFQENLQSLQMAKKDLEIIYKNARAKEREFAPKNAEVEKTVEVPVFESIAPSATNSSVPNNFQQSYQSQNQNRSNQNFRQSGYQQNRNNYQGGNSLNRNNYQGGNSQNRNNYQGNRPAFNNNRAGFNQSHQSNSNYRPQNQTKKIVESILGKVDVRSASSARVLANDAKTFGNKNKDAKRNYDEDKGMNKRALLRRGYLENEDSEERMGSRKIKIRRNDNSDKTQAQTMVIDKAVITTENLTVKILSEKIGRPVTELIKKFMILGMMVTINSTIDFATAELVSSEFNVTLEKKIAQTNEEILTQNQKVDESKLVKRPPVVTVMGHVDHGKTSLLDAFRKTDVVSGEAGGITQHVAAYSIKFNNQAITFIDTPGHAAFSAMRARGAKVTDIAILVVAADDGIMPQTVEAINHIKEAKVPMIVAINKIDKHDANPDKIMQQLTEYNIIPEAWGGDAIIVPCSAHTREGLDKLLEMILLLSEVEEFKADPTHNVTASVIEAQLDKGRGAVATIIIENGTLKIGDTLVCGVTFGKVKAMFDDKGKAIKTAGPSCPVVVLGFNEVPSAGDIAYGVDEKLAKDLLSDRKAKAKNEQVKISTVSVENFLNTKINSEKKILNIIIKGDAQGTVEALKNTLVAIESDEARVNCVSSGVGAISLNDVNMAQASGSKIICFNIKTDAKIKDEADKAKVEILSYNIIYKAADKIQELIDSMRTIKYEEKKIGDAEILAVFKSSSVGTICGCMIKNGKAARGCKAYIYRDDNLIHQNNVESLRIVKDDVKEAREGFECGIKVQGFDDAKVGDRLEFFVLEEVKNKK